jgi:hydroxyacylglutathione hydrolase
MLDSKLFLNFAPKATNDLYSVMIHIKRFTFNPFSENTYLLYDETMEAIIVDPGNYSREENEELTSFIDEKKIKPVRIVNTHAHIDHVLGVFYLKNKYNVPFVLHSKDEPVLAAVKSYAPNYGFPAFNEPEVEQWISEGDTVTFGASSLRVLFVPGHAPGHIALVNDDQKFVIGGDVLFRSSIGRTDLPGGSFETLMTSIRTQLFVLPDEYEVHPGHGETTTIGFEKKYNPFLR